MNPEQPPGKNPGNNKPKHTGRKPKAKPTAADNSADIPKTQELPTENSKLPTKPMEVHHHPEIEKKTFKQYVLEGLMIFIAVTMGFFAESLREHINEHDKEVKYMKTFAQDLRTDSASLVASINIVNSTIKNLDSLIALLNSPAIGTANFHDGARLYYYARTATRNLSFQSDDRTMSQLKNAGGYSVIKNKTVIDSIIVYEKLVERYGLTNAVALQESQYLYPYMAKIFKGYVFQSMVMDNYAVIPPPGNPQLEDNDPKLINELIYYLHQRKSTFIFERVSLEKIQAREKVIYNLLSKEYDLGE